MKIYHFLIALTASLLLFSFNASAQGATINDPILTSTLYTGSYSDSRSNVEYGNEIGQPSDDVFYAISLPVARTLTISTCGSGFDTYLHLLNASGTEITYNDDFGPACQTLQASISYTLAAGTYYVVVEGYGYNTGNYQLSLTCTPFTPLIGNNMANPINMGTLTAGTSYSDTKNNDPANGFGNDFGQPSDDIYYKFTLNTTQLIKISTCNSQLADTYLHILNASGTELFYNDDNGPLCAGLKASISTTLQPGTYYIITEGWNNYYGNITLDVNIPSSNGTSIITSYAQAMGQVFAHLEVSRVPYGLLRDIALEETNLNDFDGVLLTDSNYVNKGSFSSLYNTLLTAKISANGPVFSSPGLIDSTIYQTKQPGKVVLAGLYYNYSRFTDDAVTNNKVTIVNNQVYDNYVNGNWQNPYETAATMAIGPMSDVVEGKSQQFILPAALWLTNNGSAVSTIQMDAGDGQGYRMVTLGQAVPVMYADTGVKNLLFKITLSNNTNFISQARLRIIPTVIEINGNRVVTNVTAYLGNSRYAEGYMTIQYANPALGMQHPLIVVEGFDPGTYLDPDQKFGTETIDTFLGSIPRQSALSNILNTNQQVPTTPLYDIVYVDWKDATDDIKNNAELLKVIINQVNALKGPGDTETGKAGNIVVGVSMGGLVARWALKDMENHAQDHETKLYVSFDSPHLGVNVPVGLQYANKHLKSLFLEYNDTAGGFIYKTFINSTDGTYRTLALVNRPSARQMLINWIDDNLLLDNSAHNTWQTELKNMGYPSGIAGRPFKKIAISDGSVCGVDQQLAPGATIIGVTGKANTTFIGDFLSGGLFATAGNLLNNRTIHLGSLPGKNEISANVNIHAVNYGGGNQVYHNKITFKKTLFYIFPITSDLVNFDAYAPAIPLTLDSYAGGFYSSSTPITNSESSGWFGSHNIQVEPLKSFSYIPEVSSLDIGSGNVTFTDADYRAAHSGTNPPASPKNSPFANFITASTTGNNNNLVHTGFNVRNANWLATELQGNSAIQCPALCNLGIMGEDYICAAESYSVANLPAGANVVWTLSNGGTFTTYNNVVTVTATTTSGESGILTGTVITGNPCNDSYSITKILHFGIPPQPITGNTDICAFTVGNVFEVQPIATATAYNWTVSPNTTASISGSGTQADLTVNNPGQYYVSLSVDTQCGTVPIGGVTVIATDCTGGGVGGGLNRYMAYPNPASNNITVTSMANENSPSILILNEKNAKDKVIKTQLQPRAFTYKILDKYGKVWQHGKSKGEDLQADVSKLPNGIYFIHFTSGKETSRKQIIIQH